LATPGFVRPANDRCLFGIAPTAVRVNDRNHYRPDTGIPFIIGGILLFKGRITLARIGSPPESLPPSFVP